MIGPEFPREGLSTKMAMQSYPEKLWKISVGSTSASMKGPLGYPGTRWLGCSHWMCIPYGGTHQLSHLVHVSTKRVGTFARERWQSIALEIYGDDERWSTDISGIVLSLSALEKRTLVKALKIDSCGRLSGPPLSTGNRLLLEKVWMERCPLLESQPPSFFQLPALQQLAVDNCKGWRDVGDSFGALTSLRLVILNSKNIGEAEQFRVGLSTDGTHARRW